MSSHRTSLSPHLPPPTVPPDFATLPSSSSSPLGKEQLGTSAVLQEDMVLSLVPGAPWSCQSCAPLPPGQEGRKGWQKAGHAYLLCVRVSVIPQARVGQHKPMFLPLQVHRAGGGKGKNRREIGSYQGKRRNKEGCSALRPLGLPPPPRPSQIPLVTFSWERGTR